MWHGIDHLQTLRRCKPQSKHCIWQHRQPMWSAVKWSRKGSLIFAKPAFNKVKLAAFMYVDVQELEKHCQLARCKSICLCGLKRYCCLFFYTWVWWFRVHWASKNFIPTFEGTWIFLKPYCFVWQIISSDFFLLDCCNKSLMCHRLHNEELQELH